MGGAGVPEEGANVDAGVIGLVVVGCVIDVVGVWVDVVVVTAGVLIGLVVLDEPPKVGSVGFTGAGVPVSDVVGAVRLCNADVIGFVEASPKYDRNICEFGIIPA
jgi:hypothetical protein